MSSIFIVKKQKWLTKQRITKLNDPCQKNDKAFRNRLNRCREIATRNMTQTEHVDALCCCLKIYDDAISGRNVKTLERNVVANLKVASSSNFRDFPKRSLCDSEVGDSSGDMNTICSRPEVDDKVISSDDVDTFRSCVVANLWVAISSSFRENRNKPFL